MSLSPPTSPSFHLTTSPSPQGGLTWLWLDSPYVIAARKLFNWALEANDKGNVFPVGLEQADLRTLCMCVWG